VLEFYSGMVIAQILEVSDPVELRPSFRLPRPQPRQELRETPQLGEFDGGKTAFSFDFSNIFAF